MSRSGEREGGVLSLKSHSCRGWLAPVWGGRGRRCVGGEGPLLERRIFLDAMYVTRDREKPTSHTPKNQTRGGGENPVPQSHHLSLSLSTAGSHDGSYICFRIHGPVGKDASVWDKRSVLCMLRTPGERHGWPCKNAFVAVRAHKDASSGAGLTRSCDAGRGAGRKQRRHARRQHF